MNFQYPLMLDGATGTELQKRGLPSGTCPELWTLNNPEHITAIQRAYADAGSDAVYAPTFGVNRVSLASHSIKTDIRALCRDLVNISREAVGGRALVGGDIAPCGIQLPPAGEGSFDELVDVFTEQAQALEEAGVDFFGIETQMSLAEARATVTAVRSVSEKPIFVSFTCGPTGRTLFGGSLASALLSLQDMGVEAFGVNCCGDLDLIVRLLSELKEYTRLPLIVKPNAGLPDMSSGRAIYKMEAAQLAARVPDFIRGGAGLLGGCCGTDASHIAAIKLAAETCAYSLPVGSSVGFCASEARVVQLDGDVEIVNLEISEDLPDEAEDATLIKLKLRDMEDVIFIEQNQSFIKAPLLIECEDGDVLSRFLRIYNGKPVIL